jgi:hypothetical protein
VNARRPAISLFCILRRPWFVVSVIAIAPTTTLLTPRRELGERLRGARAAAMATTVSRRLISTHATFNCDSRSLCDVLQTIGRGRNEVPSGFARQL